MHTNGGSISVHGILQLVARLDSRGFSNLFRNGRSDRRILYIVIVAGTARSSAVAAFQGLEAVDACVTGAVVDCRPHRC